MNSEPVISYCVTCMNRMTQLQATLEKNLEVVSHFENKVELCLVNFIKDEEGEKIDQWVRSIGSVKGFKYGVSRELPYWHASIAKNTAHLQGGGKLLINLDCDNFLAPQVVHQLLELDQALFKHILFSGFTGGFNELETRHKNVFKRVFYSLKSEFQPKNFNKYTLKKQAVLLRSQRGDGDQDFNGTYGHIGLSRGLFHFINGYNESLSPMGGQDKDLLWRAYNVGGVKFIHLPQPQDFLPIQNDKTASLAHTQLKKSSWKEIERASTQLILDSIKSRAIRQVKKKIGVEVENVIDV